ncbi:MAG: hypothetical protein V4479_02145 [Actinomycetota bacterium]
MTSAPPPKICASFRAGGELCPDGIRNVLDYARLSENLGFSDFDAADHVVLGRSTEGYPGGEFRWPPDSFWPDPLVVLAASGESRRDTDPARRSGDRGHRRANRTGSRRLAADERPA